MSRSRNVKRLSLLPSSTSSTSASASSITITTTTTTTTTTTSSPPNPPNPPNPLDNTLPLRPRPTVSFSLSTISTDDENIDNDHHEDDDQDTTVSSTASTIPLTSTLIDPLLDTSASSPLLTHSFTTAIVADSRARSSSDSSCADGTTLATSSTTTTITTTLTTPTPVSTAPIHPYRHPPHKHHHNPLPPSPPETPSYPTTLSSDHDPSADDMALRPLLSMITNVTENRHGYPTPSHSPPTQDEVTCWLVDTRKLWPGYHISSAPGAAKALALISPEERQAITTKVFIQDARMSLASALVKRLYVCKALGCRWEEVRLGRRGDPKHGKPCAVDVTGRPIDGVDFNVSHQGGLVALVGYDGRVQNHDFSPSSMVYGLISPTTRNQQVTVGVDIVCVNERDDYRTIDADGLDGWVDIYDFVFSAEERWSMKYDVDYVTMLDGSILKREEIGRHDRCITRHKNIHLLTPGGRHCTFSSERIIEAKLRRFYTFFCYKEAYIKLSGEALLAPWLRQLEFFNVRSPKPGAPLRCDASSAWGETVEDVEVHLRSRPVTDVKMRVQAFEEDFMLSTAMQGEISGLKMPNFTTLDLAAEILDVTGKDTRHSRPDPPLEATTPKPTLALASTPRRVEKHQPTVSIDSVVESVVDIPPPLDSPPADKIARPQTPPPSSKNRISFPAAASPTPKHENPYAQMNEVPLCLM